MLFAVDCVSFDCEEVVSGETLFFGAIDCAVPNTIGVSELIMLTVSEQEPHCEIITSVTDSFALTENPKSESLAICGVW